MNASTALFERYTHTVAEYRRMAELGLIDPDARTELIEGEIVRMPPIGSAHAGIVGQLTTLFGRAVGDDAVVWVQNPVELSDRSQPQPDVALLRPRTDFYKRSRPVPDDVLLLVEVADSTLAYDRDVKVPLYARRGIVETWLVDVAGRRITAFGDPGTEGYRRRDELADLRAAAPAMLPNARLDLSALF